MSTKRTERGAPYHFAGRTKELVTLRNRLDMLAETGTARDGIALVTGVPGAGKTTLVERFAQSCAKEPGVSMIDGGVTQLVNPTHLFLRMGTAIGAKEEFQKIADVHTRKKGGHLSFFRMIRVGLEYDHARTTIELEGLLQTSAEAGLWKGKKLIVSIDELQTLEPQQAPQLKVLHEGTHHCPILTVGAGLQNTPDVLAGYGMSRTVGAIVLNPLKRDATCEVISKSLAGEGRAAPSHVVDALAAASQDFPQHIHCYIAAALDAVKESVGWFDPHMLDKVKAEGDERRARYYEARLRAMNRGYSRMTPVIGRMKQGGIRSLTMQDAIDAVDAAGLDGGKAVDDAVQHGVLTPEPQERVSFGIPSFHSYMETALEPNESGQDRSQKASSWEKGPARVP